MVLVGYDQWGLSNFQLRQFGDSVNRRCYYPEQLYSDIFSHALDSRTVSHEVYDLWVVSVSCIGEVSKVTMTPTLDGRPEQ